MHLRASLAVLCAALAVAATDDGSWQLRTPSGIPPAVSVSSVPLGCQTNRRSNESFVGCCVQSWAASASGDAFMWVVGGTSGGNATYQYSWSTNSWSNIGFLPWYVSNFVATDVAWYGGNLFLFGGAATGFPSGSVWIKSTTTATSSSNGWNKVPAQAIAPSPRSGHTLTLLNGYAFVIGGWNTQSYFAGVWAFDLTQLSQPIGGWSHTTWVNLLPDNYTGSDAPHARNGHTVVTYEDRLVLFGGFYHNPLQPYVNTDDCKRNPALQCTFYNDVWVYIPGAPVSTAAKWVNVSPTSPSAVVPPPRYGHVSGLVDAQTVVVFGGTGAQGPLNDLWAFDIASATWRQLQPNGAIPPASGLPVGNSIGRHFVVYEANNPSQLYVYYPPVPLTPGSAAPSVTCPSTAHGGTTAGIVITILLCIATLAFSILSWQRLGGAFAMPGRANKARPPVPLASNSVDIYENM